MESSSAAGLKLSSPFRPSAIAPILGHGSFPYGQKYVQLKQDIQYEHGYTDSDEPIEEEYPVIPTHSHLTMAWVEGGILGGICWIYIFALTVRSIFHLSSLRPNLAPLYCYFLVGFLWDILYSPFGSVNRIWGAYFILLSYFILKTSEEQAQLVRQTRAKQISIGRNLRPRRDRALLSRRHQPLTRAAVNYPAPEIRESEMLAASRPNSVRSRWH